MSVDGGAVVALCDAPNGRGGDWGPDDSIIFAPDGSASLFQVSAAGGTPRPVTTLDKKDNESSHRSPQLLPGGQTVLFTVQSINTAAHIDVQSLATGKRHTVVDRGAAARYVPGGHLIYGVNGVPQTNPFDLERLVVTGPPVPVPDDLGESLISNLWQIAVSASGSLAFVPSGRVAASRRSLVWVDRHGVASPLSTEVHQYESPRLSPDGQRLALQMRAGQQTDIWIHEIGRDRLMRLTSDGSSGPVWSPDGTKLAFQAFQSTTSVVAQRASDGSGPIERLSIADAFRTPTSWSPDGRTLSVVQNLGDTGDRFNHIWALSLDGVRPLRPITRLPGVQFGGRISPDGRWLAYYSSESGQGEVYVTSFPEGTGKSQVSTGGGTQPVWARSGRELFYRNASKLMSVAIDARAGFVAAKPTMLFDGPYLQGAPCCPTYDVSVEGDRFVMIRTEGEDTARNQVNVVLGWAEELTRRSQR